MDRERGGGEQSEGRIRAALESGLRSRLGELVTRSGLKLRDIAKILDADEFVVREGRGAREFDAFDVKGFTDREWKAGRYTLALPEKIDHVKHVILPPGEGEITRGDGSGIESKEIIPRMKYLIDVLTDLKISYEIVSGENTANMVRKETYNVFVLDAQKKLFFVNNEEGNATFIVYNIHAPKEEWETYASFTKDELGASQDVARVIYTSEADWKDKMRTLLGASRLPSDEALLEIARPSDSGPAPEGWQTRTVVKAMFPGRGQSTIDIAANRYRDAHPEWFGQYLNKGKLLSRHYHPELIDQLKKDFAKRKRAPEGWMSRRKIAGIAGRHSPAVDSMITKVLADLDVKEGWAEMYDDALGHADIEHIRPDIVAEVIRRLVAIEVADARQYTLGSLAGEFGVTWNRVDSIAAPYKVLSSESRAQYFVTRLHLVTKKVEEYLTQQMVDIVKAALAERKSKAPPGWLTVRGLAKILSVHSTTIERYVEPYRSLHAEWFGDYEGAKDVVYEHLSPELVKRIQQKFAKAKDQP